MFLSRLAVVVVDDGEVFVVSLMLLVVAVDSVVFVIVVTVRDSDMRDGGFLASSLPNERKTFKIVYLPFVTYHQGL